MILSNQMYCPACKMSIYSAHRHDFVYCFVDGGMDYLRRTLNGIDQSIVISDEDYKGLLAAIEDETKNSLGKLCSIARYLRDSMGINISEKKGDKER
jgi:hypothetical protein